MVRQAHHDWKGFSVIVPKKNYYVKIYLTSGKGKCAIIEKKMNPFWVQTSAFCNIFKHYTNIKIINSDSQEVLCSLRMLRQDTY
jgi:hypothetical protein